CWTNDVEPPTRIEAGATVTWESESCGIATGTEGEVVYKLEGTVITTQLHWDDPFIGSNSADITPLDSVGFHTTASINSGNNTTASFSIGILDSSGDGIPDAWKTGGIPIGPGLPNYQLPGAIVGHHDLYVEVDAMTGFAPLALPTITAVNDSSAGPITFTTSGKHGLGTGTHVTISGVTGDNNANGNFTVTRIDSTHFSLQGTTGQNIASNGGTWSLTDITNADNAN